MIIGVISDSHRETKVAASAIEWLLARGADLLVHAGDIVESETLRLLRQSGKPYFAVLGNNDEALAELKNEFNLHDEPFCTEFTGLRLKIMHHPFYLFDEEPVAQNEADGLNLDADLGADSSSGADADRAVNFRRDCGAGLVKNSGFSDEANSDLNLGSNRSAYRGEILIANSKATACSVNLNSNFNTASADKILNGARRTDANFKNISSASANLKSGQYASLNASLGLNVGANSNVNLDLGADLASGTNVNLNSNASANLAADMSPDMNSKASFSVDRAVNLTAPSLSANLVAPNSCANLAAPNLNSNLTASLSPNTSGEGKNRGLCQCGADRISTIKIYGHTHFFAVAIDKNGALVLNPDEICGRKKRLFDLSVLWCKSENCAYFVSVRSAKNYKATERRS
ncbi:metallophosphoesterase family protein [uncultured Campylobacter sp.]|uniref:metallophosphoesterase family protein n=1 Tax=uncultured Campylobacter sp. TaxID=218934 RepID=UPI002613955C|nr:metallophosphoesterase family protein [uncultured Campylobacter sp.]